MTHLSVNLNKVALLRNQRDIGYPDLIEHAEMILEAGANGLTAHPRPDERHIRKSDIPALSECIATWNAKNNASIEFNIEGYPSEEFITLVTTHECDQVTLVPDAPDQRTSDHGWDIDKHADFLSEIIVRLHAHKRRVSLFIDPDPGMPEKAQAVGADRVELYTGPYAFAWEADDFGTILHDYVETAEVCESLGLGINA
ncbi:MAG: pyridoxine 5'-phosphate synthase, partial [Pseudomonadota bacterium]